MTLCDILTFLFCSDFLETNLWFEMSWWVQLGFRVKRILSQQNVFITKHKLEISQVIYWSRDWISRWFIYVTKKNGDPAKYSGGRNHYAKMTFCKQNYLLVHLHWPFHCLPNPLYVLNPCIISILVQAAQVLTMS